MRRIYIAFLFLFLTGCTTTQTVTKWRYTNSVDSVVCYDSVFIDHYRIIDHDDTIRVTDSVYVYRYRTVKEVNHDTVVMTDTVYIKPQESVAKHSSNGRWRHIAVVAFCAVAVVIIIRKYAHN